MVAALLGDVLADLGLEPPLSLLACYAPDQPREYANVFRLAAVSAWLLADGWMIAARPDAAAIDEFLLTTVPELAAQAPADAFVNEPDRREELARTLLARLDFRPEGETQAQAADRLSMISAAERSRLLEASRAAEERARAVREALARQAAQESADKWTRE